VESRLSTFRTIAFFALLFSGAFLSHSLAAASDFPKVPEGFRIGMEIELAPERFAPMTRYFDFDEFQRELGERVTQKLPESFFSDYLKDSPHALNDLPEELRAQLTRGLVLESLLTRSSALPQSPAMREKPKEKSPLSRQHFQAGPGGLHIPKTVAPILPWEELDARWNALDLETRRSVVRWEHLSPLKKAELAIDHATCSKLKPKKDLMEGQQKLFQKLYWSKDGENIEFRHKEDVIVDNPQEFYQDVRHVARLAGPMVETKLLDDPTLPLKGVAFHYHMSVAGKDLSGLGEAINDLMLVKYVASGDIMDLTRKGSYLYEPGARTKGLVRVIGKDRIESRAHVERLVDELGFRIKLAGMKPEKAVRLVYAEVSKLLTGEVVETILKHQPSYLLPMIDRVSVPGLREALRREIRNFRAFPWNLSDPEDLRVFKTHLAEAPILSRVILNRNFKSHPAIVYREFPGIIPQLVPAPLVAVEIPGSHNYVQKLQHPVIESAIEKLSRNRPLEPWEKEFLLHTVTASNEALASLLRNEEPSLEGFFRLIDQDNKTLSKVAAIALTKPYFKDRLAKNLEWRTKVLRSLVDEGKLRALSDFPWDVSNRSDAEILQALYLTGSNERRAEDHYASQKGVAESILDRLSKNDPELLRSVFPSLADRFDLSPFPEVSKHYEYREPPYWVMNGKESDTLHKISQGTRLASLPENERKTIDRLLVIPLNQNRSRQDDFFRFMLDQEGECRELAIQRLSHRKPGDSTEIIRRLQAAIHYDENLLGRLKAILPAASCDLGDIAAKIGATTR
jgi:hypothetical protein